VLHRVLDHTEYSVKIIAHGPRNTHIVKLTLDTALTVNEPFNLSVRTQATNSMNKLPQIYVKKQQKTLIVSNQLKALRLN